MEVKKHPALLASLVVLALAAVAGVVLSALEIGQFAANEAKLKTKDATAAALLDREPVALTEDNVKLAQEVLAKFTEAEAAHRAQLAGSPAAQFEADFKGEPGELGSEIKEFVERWRAKLKAEGLPVIAPKPDEFAFGFSRYYQTGVNPQKALSGVYRQTRIVDFLLKTLVDSKLKENVRLLSVEREPIELPGVSVGSFNKDETPAAHDASLRRPGLIQAETFRLRFTARTEVIRRFVNAVTDSGRPLSVRGIEIVPATREQLADPRPPGSPLDSVALPAGLFGEAPAATATTPAAPPVESKPELVIPSAPVVVTVTLAYLAPVKPEAAAVPSTNP